MRVGASANSSKAQAVEGSQSPFVHFDCEHCNACICRD